MVTTTCAGCLVLPRSCRSATQLRMPHRKDDLSAPRGRGSGHHGIGIHAGQDLRRRDEDRCCLRRAYDGSATTVLPSSDCTNTRLVMGVASICRSCASIEGAVEERARPCAADSTDARRLAVLRAYVYPESAPRAPPALDERQYASKRSVIRPAFAAGCRRRRRQPRSPRQAGGHARRWLARTRRASSRVAPQASERLPQRRLRQPPARIDRTRPASRDGNVAGDFGGALSLIAER